jgi:hypothetical protein
VSDCRPSLSSTTGSNSNVSDTPPGNYRHGLRPRMGSLSNPSSQLEIFIFGSVRYLGHSFHFDGHRLAHPMANLIFDSDELAQNY